MSPKVRYAWLVALPTTQLRICLTLIAFVLTAIRYLFLTSETESLPDFGTWLTFLTAWAVVDGGVLLGKRATSDPEVIAAEAAAREQATPPAPVLPEGQP